MVAQEAGALLLTQPISALDIAHQIEVLALARRTCHETGPSAVIVLYEVNIAARFCDHVIALKGGRLVRQGEPADQMQPAVLEQIYGLPMQVLERPGGNPIALPA